MFTLNSTEVHCVAYGIGSYHSNAWKSKNPHSGVYLAETAKTLDALNCGSPSCNQGGVIQWDEKEVSPTLRQQMKHHEPVVVIENEADDIKPMGCAEQAHSLDRRGCFGLV